MSALEAVVARTALTPEERHFVESFRDGTLDAGGFHHRDHVRLAFLVLRVEPLPAALETFSRGLRRLAASVGRPERYHETVTWALLLLIHEARQRHGPDRTWEAFAADHPDLLEWPSPLLARIYREETLGSDFARRTFVLPDRGGDATP